MSPRKVELRRKMETQLASILKKTNSTLNMNEASYICDMPSRTKKAGAVVSLAVHNSAINCCLAAASKRLGGRVVVIDCDGALGTKDWEYDNMDESNEIFLSIAELELADYVQFGTVASINDLDTGINKIGCLVIDGREWVGSEIDSIAHWKESLGVGGVIAVCGAGDLGAVDQLVDGNLYIDSSFIEVAAPGRIRAFQKCVGAPKMILASGLQSGGTTIISWSFLQRPDMAGILDMWNEGILLMPYVSTRFGWCKMTTSCFRWHDVADFYRDQGWEVRPLLIIRDVRSAYASLRRRPYGLNGNTAEDPPLRTRFRRFLRDWEEFSSNGWPILRFESLCSDPESTLRVSCRQLEIPYHEDMISWPKSANEISDLQHCNETFKSSLKGKRLKDTLMQGKEDVVTTGISKQDMIWLEDVFRPYNEKNAYPVHVPLDQPSEFPDRANYLVTRRRQFEITRETETRQFAQCKERLRRMRASRSWRLTAPLRRLHGQLSKRTYFR